MAEFSLPCGRVVLIDDEDLAICDGRKWYADPQPTGVVYVRARNPYVRLHRLIMKAEGKEVVDHINGDGLDNRRINLRKCSQSKNLMNKRKMNHKKHKGVYFDAKRQKYWGQAWADGKAHFTGYVDTEREAAIRYNQIASQIQGEFARLNIIVD